MTISTYRDLLVWQKSVSFVTRIYELTRSFPSEERFGLISQIRRCSVSIPSNIAEGHGRYSTNDYIRFLRIAIGSLCELQTQLLIASNLGFLASENFQELEGTSRDLERMLTSLVRKLTQ